MLNFLRPKLQFSPTPVELSNSEAHGRAVGMQRAIRLERRYWRRIAVEVTSGFVLMVLVGALLYGVRAVGTIPGWESPWSQWRLDISPQTGLVALGLLATLVIGLQVSVRGMPVAGDAMSTLGRQLALETAARATGYSAFAISLAVAGFYVREGIVTDPAALLAVLAASVLLAGIAADATCASYERFGDDIEKARKLSDLVRLVAISRLRQIGVPRATLASCVSQIILGILAPAVVAGLLFVLIWPSKSVVEQALGASAFVALVGVGTTLALILARAASAFRSYSFAAYMWLVWGATLATSTLSTFVVVLKAAAQDDFFAPFAAPLLVMFVWVGQSLLISGRIPAIRGQLVGSLGYHSVSKAITLRIAKLRDELADHPSTRNRPSASSIITLIVALALPPAGAISSHLQLRALPTPATRTTLRISLGISYALIAGLCAVTFVAVIT